MTIPLVVQRAFVACLTGDAYRDAAGDYRLYSRHRRVAPWNPVMRTLYPNAQDFDQAADRWLMLWEAVPTARLRPSGVSHAEVRS